MNRLKIATEVKDIGNKYFTKEDYQKAIEKYAKVILLLS